MRYIDSRSVLVSATEAVCLFSIGNQITAILRHSLTPQMFEAILFLKFNARIWDSQLVSSAIQLVRRGFSGINTVVEAPRSDV